MKQLTNLKFMAMALFVAMLSMSLTACSDDDDNNDNDKGGSTTSAIVGSWRSNNSEGYEIMTFKKDGTGTEEWSEKGEKSVEKFRYVFSESNMMLKVTKEDGEMEIYTVKNLTSTSMVLDDGDISETYYKI